MTRPDFPLVWDNTMRSTFVACPRKFAFEHLHHWKPQRPSIDLHAGAAWARALEVARKEFYLNNASPDFALEAGTAALIAAYGDFDCPPESPKSLSRLCEALVFYFERFPFASDPVQPYVGASGPMIEFSFVLPLDDALRHPLTGDPILYAGRADMIATYAGALSVYDDKTTKALGPLWANQWDTRSQFTGYTWAAQEFGLPVTQTVVRGISILKTKLDSAQAITFREPHRILRWKDQVIRDIRRAIQCWKDGYWDWAEADACSSYSGCIFRHPCMSADPTPWLETSFVQRKWDPVSRTEDEVKP